MCFLCQTLDPKDVSPDFHAFDTPPPSVSLVVNNDDAAPDGLTTTNQMEVGDVFSGTLDYVGDTDWIAIHLDAGQSIRIAQVSALGPTGMNDPYLRLYDADGTLVAQNDDVNGFSYNSEIEFTVYQTGTYYIQADSYSGRDIGAYEISARTFTPPTPDPFVVTETIDWGTQIVPEGGTIHVYFAANGEIHDGIDSEGWNAYERGQFRMAFDYIQTLVNVSFVITNDVSEAEMILVNDRDQITDLGYFNPPGTTGAGIGVFGADDWDRTTGGDLEQGGYGYVTIVHELLHGMGLAHPHDNGGTSTVLELVDSAFGDAGAYTLNQGIYTTMSYNSGFLEGPVGTFGDPAGLYGFEAGPMALDIAVLQQKYGANMTTATGDDTYTLASVNAPGTYWQSIWDAGGQDTLRHDGTTAAVIDLRAASLQDEEGGGGFASAVRGIAGGVTIANGVVIEVAMGGAGNDTITGNDADNTLYGNGGSDVIDAGRGTSHDTVEGGAGHDDVWGWGGDDVLDGGTGNDTLRGGRENDSLSGGDGDDSLVGQRNIDTISGGTGDDTLKGGGGSDWLIGEDDDDFLKGGTYRDTLEGGAGSDTLAGNRHDDLLIGGAGADTMNGGGDDDTLDGGTGNDSMHGGAGADVFVFDTGHDADLIDDFSLTEDRLQISLSLAGGLTEAQIESAAQVTALGVELDFGGGDTILLQGLGATAGLAGAIEIV